MTIGQLKRRIHAIPDALPVIIRIPTDEEPNGNCFDLGSISIEIDHVTEEEFAGFDCNQDGDLSGTGFLPSYGRRDARK